MLALRSFLFVTISLFATLTWAEEETPASLEGATRISAEQLFELAEMHEDLVIVDSRISTDREKGWIETSIGLPDTDTTPAALAKHIASKTTPVIFYCNGPKCGRSYKAAKMALANGYNTVYWFRGGWEEWTNKGLPVEK